METNIDIGHLIYAVVLLLAVVFMMRGRFKSAKQGMQYFMIWVVIFAVGMLVYVAQDEIMGRLVPSEATVNEAGDIILHKADNGHFYMNALVNGKDIRFMVDTGATRVAISPRDAEKLGVVISDLVYNQPINTANGSAFAAAYRIDHMEVGGAYFSDIRASINQAEMKNSLLGMSFLEQLSSFTVERDKLILRP